MFKRRWWHLLWTLVTYVGINFVSGAVRIWTLLSLQDRNLSNVSFINLFQNATFAIQFFLNASFKFTFMAHEILHVRFIKLIAYNCPSLIFNCIQALYTILSKNILISMWFHKWVSIIIKPHLKCFHAVFTRVFQYIRVQPNSFAEILKSCNPPKCVAYNSDKSWRRSIN